MAEIKPFCGLRYDEKKVDLASVLALPYDVISSVDKKRYYEADPHNIVRVILGKDLETDDEKRNRYTRSRDYFLEWRSKGIIVKDEKPCIYRYDIEYELAGEKRIRRGFLARLKLSDFEEEEVLPHENTFDKHREDRLRLLKMCNANFSPIFTLYEGDGQVDNALEAASEGVSCLEIVFGKGTVHKLWPVCDPDAVARVAKLLASKKVFIADGHHRYETALMNAKEMASVNPDHTGEESYNYIMVCLTSLEDDGLVILPTHRLVRNIADPTLAALPGTLSQIFDVVPSGKINEEAMRRMHRFLTEKAPKHCFGMLIGDELFSLELRPGTDIDRVIWKNHSPRYKRLDVTILHEAIIERFLGKDWHNEEDIAYLKKEDELLDLMRKGEYQVAFFLNPTLLEQMKEIASQREIMPPKSTYFYPKLLSGIVINELD